MNRRQFAAVSAGAAIAAAARSAAAAPGDFKKGICAGVFPKEMPYPECFKQARNAGFDGIELPIDDRIPLEATADELKRLGDSAREAGITIVSLWVSNPLGTSPLNSPDAEVRARGVAAIRRAVSMATQLGCGSLLLVPGRIGTGTRFEVGYQTTWERFTVELKKVIPAAARAKIVLAMENVGNKFLLSPIEARAFVDQFKSPALQFFFDVGNVMTWGYPEDWILTLGPRIKRVHLKDRKMPARGSQTGGPVQLGEGDVNWKAVMAAFVQTGYRGFMCPEIGHDPNDTDS